MNGSLAGWRVAITRPLAQSGDAVARIAREGGVALCYPLIDIVLRDGDAAFLQAIATPVDVWVFTSVNGVRAYVEGVKWLGSGVFSGQAAYCVGTATANAAKAVGFSVQVLPKVASAEHLPDVMGEAHRHRHRILLVRGNLADAALPRRLTQMGYEVNEAIGYETVTTDAADDLFLDACEQRVNAIAFYSGSAVKALLAGREQSLPLDCVLATVGPKTAEAAREYGYAPQVVAATASTVALVDALTAYAKRL